MIFDEVATCTRASVHLSFLQNFCQDMITWCVGFMMVLVAHVLRCWMSRKMHFWCCRCVQTPQLEYTCVLWDFHDGTVEWNDVHEVDKHSMHILRHFDDVVTCTRASGHFAFLTKWSYTCIVLGLVILAMCLAYEMESWMMKNGHSGEFWTLSVGKLMCKSILCDFDMSVVYEIVA